MQKSKILNYSYYINALQDVNIITESNVIIIESNEIKTESNGIITEW